MNCGLKLGKLVRCQNRAQLQLLRQTQIQKLPLDSVQVLVDTARFVDIKVIRFVQIRELLAELLELRDQLAGLRVRGIFQRCQLLLLAWRKIQRRGLGIHGAQSRRVSGKSRKGKQPD